MRTIALAGNPNSGKSTLFNALTGANQYVGNWPGVTLEQKSGRLKYDSRVQIVDLPGIYSLSPYSIEEIVAREYLVTTGPYCIVNIVDGTNLERNLFLTTQLLELGIPMVIAVNMMDVVRSRGITIDLAALKHLIGVPVIPISATHGEGLGELVTTAVTSSRTPVPLRFDATIEGALAEIGRITNISQRWLLTQLFERPHRTLARLSLDVATREQFEHVIVACEEAEDDDAISMMAIARYQQITGIVSDLISRPGASLLTTSDKVDRVLTNRWLALPIFAAVMFVVYYISVSTIGAYLTDWTNDVLFGTIVPDHVSVFLQDIGTAEWMQRLIVEGIIGGVGAVLGFIPQMFLLFAMLAILESSGYMARVAFIMDRVFRQFGFSGKSFIPMLIGTGCSLPGIMASRTIENERDRKLTVLTTSFIPCGVKLAVIALITGAIFDGAWWVAPSAYFAGIGAVIISGIILKKSLLFAGDPAPFVMEIPPYHVPPASTVLRSTWERGYSFIRRAGSIILLATIAIWFLANVGWDSGFHFVDDLNTSLLAATAGKIAWVFAPLGWGTWQATSATFTGLIAKESVVGTFGVLFGRPDVSDNGVEIWGQMAAHFTILAGYSFLFFNLLCAPCFAAIGAIRREMGDARWTAFAVAWQTGFAWAIAFIFYQVGVAFRDAQVTGWTMVAAAMIALFVWLLVKSPAQSGRVPLAWHRTREQSA